MNKVSDLPKGPKVVFFSSATENTARFVDKVGLPALRLPLRKNDDEVLADEPYVLFVPTYGGGRMEPKYAIPKQVMSFLKVEENRTNCLGVVSSGNTNFGEAYLIAGKLISSKLQVPFLYGYELLGTDDDVSKVRQGIESNWGSLLRRKQQEQTENADA